MKQKDIDRFWSKVDIRGPDECWPWLGGCDRNGYGKLGINGKVKFAHRIAYILIYGDTKLQVCHKPVICHNRICCNQKHLYAGTAARNRNDQKLDKTECRKPVIRSDGKIYSCSKEAASQMGIDRGNLCRVCRGRRKSAGGYGWAYYEG